MAPRTAAGSPYRTPGAPAAEAPAPRPSAARSRLNARTLAIGGSLLLHAAPLIISSLSPAAYAEPVAVPARTTGNGAFFVHADPLDSSEERSWPLPEAMTACFDRETLEAKGHVPSTVQAYGYAADPRRSWSRFATPEGAAPDDPDAASYLIRDEIEDCTRTAAGATWSGRGRVFVRVTREPGGTALVQALPLDEAANDPALLCCLRGSQSMLLRSMSNGETTRYVIEGQGATVAFEPPPQ